MQVVPHITGMADAIEGRITKLRQTQVQYKIG